MVVEFTQKDRCIIISHSFQLQIIQNSGTITANWITITFQYSVFISNY